MKLLCWKILKLRKGKFLIAVVCVFIVAVCGVKAAFQGVKTSTRRWIPSGHILFIIQAHVVAIYSFMFTIAGALPGFYFLGPKDD
ncbi:DUF2534 family protein [Klebsiella pneumoniae]|uniref:DUF2534 family protein n=1 Tax=Klebsiella pneumoniae TaxID=573 RepID=UPI0013E9967A|nr:DUF2534 family protein [Klebsiella pneumoniae]NGX69048.1 DUF2534 family protein [Klebsiella pneumoniae]